MKRPAHWAALALLVAALSGCAHFPSLPARGEIAGQTVATTVDSEAARYYLAHYLRGDRRLSFPLSLLARPYAWLAGWPWEAVESMSTARSRERFARLRWPSHLFVVNYFGVPLSGQVTPLALDNYLAMRREGPNDGLTLIADAPVPGSPSLAEPGRDHFLAEDPEIGLKTLALAHLLMDRLERSAR